MSVHLDDAAAESPPGLACRLRHQRQRLQSPTRATSRGNSTTSRAPPAMGRLLNIVTSLHTATKREYLPRMVDDKVHCMLKAKEYEADYWDGDRRHGYGGYRYIEGRWKPVAQGLIELHGLKGKVRILDVGCGKGYLLREFKQLLPEAELVGFDISQHG